MSIVVASSSISVVIINILYFQNLESEKQLKFFQGCVATAFAERDHSIMEVIKTLIFKFSGYTFLLFLIKIILNLLYDRYQAEKAKEKEETMSQKLKEVENRYLISFHQIFVAERSH